jgi:hypothetical protein
VKITHALIGLAAAGLALVPFAANAETVTTTTTTTTVVQTDPAPRPLVVPRPAATPFWTAIAGSLDNGTEALSLANTLQAQDVSAAVLYSSDFSSLRPGYWVVYVGTCTTKGEAQAVADYLHSIGYSDAYPRLVSR